jgi:hypothetical protein
MSGKQWHAPYALSKKGQATGKPKRRKQKGVPAHRSPLDGLKQAMRIAAGNKCESHALERRTEKDKPSEARSPDLRQATRRPS